jgi:hypothetical protein
MKRAQTIATVFALVAWPASALAQAAATHWSALYAAPIFLASVVVLLAIGKTLRQPGWNRVGIALWFVVMTSGGCLAVYALPGIAQGKPWQLPAMLLTFLLFVYAGNEVLRKLQGH